MSKQKRPVTDQPVPVDYDELFRLAWGTYTSRFKEIVPLYLLAYLFLAIPTELCKFWGVEWADTPMRFLAWPIAVLGAQRVLWLFLRREETPQIRDMFYACQGIKTFFGALLFVLPVFWYALLDDVQKRWFNPSEKFVLLVMLLMQAIALLKFWLDYRLQLMDYCYITGRTRSFGAAAKESFRRTRGTLGRYLLFNLILYGWLFVFFCVVRFTPIAAFIREFSPFVPSRSMLLIVLGIALTGVTQPFFEFVKLIFKSSYFGGPAMEQLVPAQPKRRRGKREPEETEL